MVFKSKTDQALLGVQERATREQREADAIKKRYKGHIIRTPDWAVCLTCACK